MELESLRRNLDDKVLIVAQLHDQIADERASNQKIQAELKEQFDADKHMAIRFHFFHDSKNLFLKIKNIYLILNDSIFSEPWL